MIKPVFTRILFALSACLVSVPAPACELHGGVAGAGVSLVLQHDGAQRSYRLYLPADYRCDGPALPLVIGLHGYTGSGQILAERWSSVARRVDQDGFIGLFPDGMSQSAARPRVRGFNDLGSRHDQGPDGLTCAPPPLAYPIFENCPDLDQQRRCSWGNSCADDLGFLRALILHATQTWRVDDRRIYLFGYSQGGSTVNGLAPGLADLLAAAAPLHGFASNGYARGAAEKLPFLQVWGRADTTVRADGLPGDDRLIYDSAAETATAWARSQGCAADGSAPWPSPADGKQGWACTQHPHCMEGSEVVNCAWDGAHDWPGGADDNFGWQVLWRFFQSHQRGDGP